MSKNSTDLMAVANDKNNPSMLIYTSTMCLDCKKMKEVIKEIYGITDNIETIIKPNTIINKSSFLLNFFLNLIEKIFKK